MDVLLVEKGEQMDGKEAMERYHRQVFGGDGKLVRVERISSNNLFPTDIFGDQWEIARQLAKGETNNMTNTATSSTGDTFKEGDRVRLPNGERAVIECVNVRVRRLKFPGVLVTFTLEQLTHDEAPTDAEDAWERVTMDIGGAVAAIIGQNGYQSQMYESDRRQLRHAAYVVLGSVMKVDEEVKARVRGIIERAEKRYSTR